MSNEAIRGKVARILNSREVVINVGSVDGVAVGMFFDVLDQRGEDILDPDTGELLGSVERPKVRIRIVKVHDRLSIASTYRKRKVNVGGRGIGLGMGLGGGHLGSFSDLLMPPKYVMEYETLKTTEKTWEDLDETKSYVKTGDPVVQIFDDSVSLDDQEIL